MLLTKYPFSRLFQRSSNITISMIYVLLRMMNPRMLHPRLTLYFQDTLSVRFAL